MKIYIASSIKRNNDGVIWWTRFLREAGYTVLSFHDLGPSSVMNGLDFPEKKTLNRPAFAKDSAVRETSQKDKDAILEADVFLYLEPAGLSANRELGFAHRAGKLIIAYCHKWPPGEHDVMDEMIDIFCEQPEDVLASLQEAEAKRTAIVELLN